MIEQAKCELCGEPMPPGEEMFKFHGYSGPCPKPPLERPQPTPELILRIPELEGVVKDLIAACQYAAGSFAQVPSDQTVPPIVLHDCKDKLDKAWRAAQAKLDDRPCA